MVSPLCCRLSMVSRVVPRMVTRWGLTIPGLGIGTYLAQRGQVQDAVTCAIDVGYRHIDTAVLYGNDIEIGNALAPLFRHDKLERKNITITTKIPPTHMAPEDVERSLLDTLDKMQIQYADLLLIHSPMGMVNRHDGNMFPVDDAGNPMMADHDFVKTWKEMEKLVRCGRARQIGVSNFNIQQIEEIMQKCVITPATVQHECHAYLQQNALRSFCQKHKIVGTGYAPLGAGEGRGAEVHQHGVLLNEPVVQEIAWKLGKTPGQVLIRFVAQLGVIPIPKSVTPERIIENYEAMFFEIPEEDFKKLQELDRNVRYYNIDYMKDHPRYPHGDF